MKIARITAHPLNVGISLDNGGSGYETALSVCLVDIETDDGYRGIGMTAITEEEVVAAIVDRIAAPTLIGQDPLAIEALWERLYWLLAPRGQTGYASHAIAAIDTALWDIKGKALGQPVWRLLGGARERVPAYTTFGFAFHDREVLVAAAQKACAAGASRLKMVVGHGALKRRDEPREIQAVLREDVARVAAVRDAIGADIAIAVDANCNLDPVQAVWLAKRLEPFDLAFFEEPVTQNDVRALGELRRRTSIAIAAGQSEGLASRFRQFLTSGAVDILQPNVVIGGGYTQCLKVAGMAHAFNVPIDNGGAWAHYNLHLHAGVMNGGMVEHHLGAHACCQQIFKDLPEPADGWFNAPSAPGIGLEPDWDAVAEISRRPGAAGNGKGG